MRTDRRHRTERRRRAPLPGATEGARLPVMDKRRAGVLLHVTSLGQPGSEDGGLGASAHRFVDWLAAAGFSAWQVLPLGPTGGDGSPYWARSDHAGNPLMLDRGGPPPSEGAVPSGHTPIRGSRTTRSSRR